MVLLMCMLSGTLVIPPPAPPPYPTSLLHQINLLLFHTCRICGENSSVLFFFAYQWVVSYTGMVSVQVDMRDFINAPNGQSKQSLAANERVETDHTQSPLGGRTV